MVVIASAVANQLDGTIEYLRSMGVGFNIGVVDIVIRGYVGLILDGLNIYNIIIFNFYSSQMPINNRGKPSWAYATQTLTLKTCFKSGA